MRRYFSFFFVFVLLIALAFPVDATENTVIGGLDNDTWFTKYGNVNTSCTAEYFTNTMGLSWGDTVTVSFLEQTLVLPVVPTYSYVESGAPALILRRNESGGPEGVVSLAINMGNFGETYGLAIKCSDENGSWHWEAAPGVTFPVKVSFTLNTKGGYMDAFLLHDLVRTNERADYAHLTAEAFANFRQITTTGMAKSTLYRTSSPVNPELNRNIYADAALMEAGVKTIVNLADSQEEAQGYDAFAATYYARQNVAYLNLGVDALAPDFQSGLAKGLIHIAENEGPYALHCTEGKDRAGFVSALLECFAGATYEEVIADYMLTYYNYYGVEPGSEKYEAIAKSNIIKTLQIAFAVEDLETADLSMEAEAYIREAGLTDRQICQLRANLTGIEPANHTFIILVSTGVAVCVLAAVLLLLRRRRK